MARRRDTRSLTPDQIPQTGVARDPGLQAPDLRIQAKVPENPTPGAIRQAGASIRRAGGEIGSGLNAVANAQSQYAAAQEAFGRTMFSIGATFEALGKKRQTAQDNVMVDRVNLNATKRLSVRAQEYAATAKPGMAGVKEWDDIAKEEYEAAQREEFGKSNYTPSDEAKARFETQGLNLRAGSARSMAAQAHNNQVETAVLDATDTVTQLGAEVYSGEKTRDEAEARARSIAEGVSPLLGPKEAHAFREAAVKTIWTQWITGQLDAITKAQALSPTGEITPETEQRLYHLQRELEKVTGAPVPLSKKDVPGLVQPGNIDTADRPKVTTEKGFATVHSISIEEDGQTVLIPTISPDGQQLSNDEAVALYHETGQHLGIFDNEKDAKNYAVNLSKEQEQLYQKGGGPGLARLFIDVAQKNGLPPVVFAAISRIETAGTFSPTVRPPKGSAVGLFQINDATAQDYMGLASASGTTPRQQAEAGGKYTADRIEEAKRVVGGDPTPGEIYLFFWLRNDAKRLFGVGDDTPASKVLPASILQHNPFLKGMTVGEVHRMAETKMQANMDWIVKSGFMQGARVPDAALPIDAAHELTRLVAQKQSELTKESEKVQGEWREAMKPGGDIAGLVLKRDPEVAQAFTDAQAVVADPQSSPEGAREAMEHFAETTIKAQTGVSGPDGRPLVDPRRVEILGKDISEKFVEGMQIGTPVQNRETFYKVRDQFGKYWPMVFKELQKNGLDSKFIVYDMLDPNKDVATSQYLTAAMDLDSKKLNDLVDAPTRDEIKTSMRDQLGDVFAAMAFGQTDFGPVVKQQDAISEMLFNGAIMAVANGKMSPAEAGKKMAEVITNQMRVIRSGNVEAIIPPEESVNGGDLQFVASYIQKESPALMNFKPVGFYGLDPEADRGRTLSAARNSGKWITNAHGDGLLLMISFGDQALSWQPLLNEQGQPFEIPFDQVPMLAKRFREIQAASGGGPKTRAGMVGKPPAATPAAAPKEIVPTGPTTRANMGRP